MRPQRSAVAPSQWRRGRGSTKVALQVVRRRRLEAVVSHAARSRHLAPAAASLYRYVGPREDRLDLMTDAIIADYSRPASATGSPTSSPLRLAFPRHIPSSPKRHRPGPCLVHVPPGHRPKR